MEAAHQAAMPARVSNDSPTMTADPAETGDNWEEEALPDPTMTGEALIASPPIHADPVGTGESAGVKTRTEALERAWELHCEPIYDSLPEDRQRHFIQLRLGYSVVASDGVDQRESGSGAQEADRR